MDYTRFEIFQDISNSEVEAMINCFRMRRVRYGPGETIRVYGGSQDVGIVVRGEAELVRFDCAGTRTILERMETGGVFGELLAFTAAWATAWRWSLPGSARCCSWTIPIS